LEVGQLVSNVDVCDTRYFIESLHATAVNNRKLTLCIPREKRLKLPISMECWLNSNDNVKKIAKLQAHGG